MKPSDIFSISTDKPVQRWVRDKQVFWSRNVGAQLKPGLSLTRVTLILDNGRLGHGSRDLSAEHESGNDRLRRVSSSLKSAQFKMR